MTRQNTGWDSDGNQVYLEILVKISTKVKVFAEKIFRSPNNCVKIYTRIRRIELIPERKLCPRRRGLSTDD